MARGFDAVTVNDIAAQAGVSSVTVFNHFKSKEDLFLDRGDDAAELLLAAVRNREPAIDAVTALEHLCVKLATDRHPLSGLNDRSAPFFSILATAPPLLARARGIAAELQSKLTTELEAVMPKVNASFLAAFFIAGYGCVLMQTAQRRIAGDPLEDVAADHRQRLDQLFTALRAGVEPHE
jgi:AcrR family transcriptional regulator